MFNKDKPIVLVTGPDKKFNPAWWATRWMLFWVGISAVYVSPGKQKYPDKISGVVIGGGSDIEPEHYGLTGDAGATYDPNRDEFEMRVARKAIECHTPILGICRGAQLINVVLGGSLFVDIRPDRVHTPNRNSIFPIKDALITESSRLFSSLQRSVVRINSLHNQAIDRVGDDLEVAARDRDGFVQAIEYNGKDFIVGVQWHPEYLIFSRIHRRIFKSFAYFARQSHQSNNLSHKLGSMKN